MQFYAETARIKNSRYEVETKMSARTAHLCRPKAICIRDDDVGTNYINLTYKLDLEASVAQNLEPFTDTPRNHTDKRALR